MSKSLHTRQRYTKYFEDQTVLDGFFSPGRLSVPIIPQICRVSDHSLSSKSQDTESSVEIIEQEKLDIDTFTLHDPSFGYSVPEFEFTIEDPSNYSLASDLVENSQDDEEEKYLLQGAEEMETWEEELEMDVHSDPEIKDWASLQQQIQDDLKKNYKKLSLSKINKLIILSNFATLQIKGSSQVEASMEIVKQWQEGKSDTWFAPKV